NGVGQVAVYRKADLEEIVRQRSLALGGKAHRDESGRSGLSIREIQSKLLGKRTYQRALKFCSFWRNRMSLLRLGEPALRSFVDVNDDPTQGGPSRKSYYLEEDITRILRGDETKYRNQGRTHGRKSPKAALQEAMAHLKVLLTAGPLL